MASRWTCVLGMRRDLVRMVRARPRGRVHESAGEKFLEVEGIPTHGRT